jgi:hypothetical protein
MKGERIMKSKLKWMLLCAGLVSLGSPTLHVCRVFFLGNQTGELSEAAAAAAPVPVLMWENLRALDPQSGNMPAELKKHDGGIVRVPGFIIPLEDNDREVSEFLLVPFPMACIHVPAPPPNQIVHVKMDKGKKVEFDFYDPVWAEGRLKIQRTQNMYTDSSYFMTGMKIEPYRAQK